MPSEFRSSRTSIQIKLALAHTATLLLSVCIAEMVTLIGMVVLLRQPLLDIFGWGLHITSVLIIAAGIGLAVGSVPEMASRTV